MNFPGVCCIRCRRDDVSASLVEVVLYWQGFSSVVKCHKCSFVHNVDIFYEVSGC